MLLLIFSSISLGGVSSFGYNVTSNLRKMIKAITKKMMATVGVIKSNLLPFIPFLMEKTAATSDGSLIIDA